MTTRSKMLAYGATAGTGPVSVYTCPSGTTAIAKWVGAGFEGGGANQESVAFLFYQPAGGPVIPMTSCFAFASSAGGVGATQAGEGAIWQALDPGDQLLIADDGTFSLSVTISGAELSGTAP